MTIDETPRGPGSGGESPGMGRSRTTARDLERYAGLFARRTQGMKSSAMRDLMAITARPEIISLAGGLPDTSHVPGRGPRRADGARGGRRIRPRTAVRADRGHGRAQGLHRAGDGRGGHGRRARRHPRHHGWAAGDRPRVQDADRSRRRDRRRGPDLPRRGADVRRLRGRRRADRDGRRRHARRPARGDARPARARGPHAEVHLHRPDVPESGRRDDGARSASSAGPAGRASASCSCSRTTRMACCATRATRCRRSTHSTAAST